MPETDLRLSDDEYSLISRAALAMNLPISEAMSALIAQAVQTRVNACLGHARGYPKVIPFKKNSAGA